MTKMRYSTCIEQKVDSLGFDYIYLRVKLVNDASILMYADLAYEFLWMMHRMMMRYFSDNTLQAQIQSHLHSKANKNQQAYVELSWSLCGARSFWSIDPFNFKKTCSRVTVRRIEHDCFWSLHQREF